MKSAYMNIDYDVELLPQTDQNPEKRMHYTDDVTFHTYRGFKQTVVYDASPAYKEMTTFEVKT